MDSEEAALDGAPDGAGPSTPAEAPELDGFEELLEYLRRTRGFDFRGYKRASLTRRVQRRMQTVAVTSCADYIDYLEVRPDEFPQLFNAILINVTAFFRDGAAWEALSAQLRAITAARRSSEGIRLWCAGCASGEEAYTLAMVAAEIMGVEAAARRVKIYATDVDEEALAHARLATYTARAVEGLNASVLEKYFTRAGQLYVFHKDLRRTVIFGRHDLVQDAPISRVDALTCRNTLMYFNAETQTKIVEKLHFALAPDGVLFLGKAEMLLTHTDLFTPIDLKLRLFAPARRDSRTRERMLALQARSMPALPAPAADAALTRVAFEALPTAAVVLDSDSRVALVNARAAALFVLRPEDLGRPFHDLELSYRPAELRTCIDKARAEQRPVVLKGVERVVGSEKAYFDIEVSPLTLDDAGVGVQLAFSDVTTVHRLQEELHRAQAELEAAQEELQSASEELETTNEELQSTVEELETTNEELQSTNEELETMNEELQSTNEELQTMNEELRQRGDELNQVNGFFGAILASLRVGVAVLDEQLLVKAWNGKMEDLWGMRADEVDGKNFLNLDIGVPLAELHPSIRAALASPREEGARGDEERTLDCTNRRGKPVRCRVTVSPMRATSNRGALVLFEEVGGA